MTEVTITKLVHGGQGMGVLPDGKKVFVWGALPGETVGVRILKGKRSYAEAIAEEVITPSPLRLEPRESNYLATSPWQIIPFEAENDYKKLIVEELFTQAHIPLPSFTMTSAGDEWYYRNKMEYSFWGDDDGLHLALHSRGSHLKTIVQGSELALPAIDKAAQAILAQLQQYNLRAGDLKTIIVRCDQHGNAVAALFVKRDSFHELSLPEGVQGLRVYHSNPKSPASVPTRLLQEIGDPHLTDTLLSKSFTYDVDSFFQVNLPVFEQALQRIKDHIGNVPSVTDMYAGVGGIGLSTANTSVQLVEIDPATAAMARLNAEASGLKAEVVEAPTEKVLDYITGEQPIIFDPPRAGLHDKVIDRVYEHPPQQIVYLSCNPATHARDIARLSELYELTYFEAFNFFPHTPHIETLAVLKRK
jgi:23S rRNA (uracil1939-C5)-methyltransferase